MEEKIRRSREHLSFIRGALTAIAVIAIVYFASMVLPVGGAAKKPGTLQALRKAKEIERVIQNNYLDEIDEQKQTDYMFLGQVAGLEDEYSTYYTAEQYAAIQKKQSGSFMGIGISIAVSEEQDGEVVITECLDNYPAALAGVQPEDVILAVNGTSVEGKTSSEVAAMIQSSEGNVVLLQLKRKAIAEPLEIEIEMTEMERTSVTGEMLEDSISYIAISGFTGVTANQFKTTYGELKIQGMEKLIIDLRNNPGGLLDSVCDTLSQVLPKGVIVYTVDKNGDRKERTCEGINRIDIPLVVLVNGESASAAEIFAGAVQDYKVGTIVGEQTFGKGIVQDAFRLSDGSYLKLTVSRYYTPKGHDIHKVGIKPDVKVEMPADSETDVQLEKALEVIRKMK
ncbi:MAG: S41 family peptidase [Lachnospiraceae bacterium]|nr:S41 family peptidase [Lachnospiraceae bacterium]